MDRLSMNTVGESAELAFADITESHLPWALDLDPQFEPRSRRFSLGESWVVGCRIGPMTGRRRSGELRRTAGEFVAVLLVERGTEVLVQQGRTAEVGAGAAARWDGVHASNVSQVGAWSSGRCSCRGRRWHAPCRYSAR
jgi:hypothetical protein